MREKHLSLEDWEGDSPLDRGHLAKCEECRRRLEALRFLRFQARNLPDFTPSPFFASRMANVAASMTVPVWRSFNRIARILAPALGLATALTAVVLLSWNGSNSATDGYAQALLAPWEEPEVTVDDLIIPAGYEEETVETPR